jgi:hypothetical protein
VTISTPPVNTLCLEHFVALLGMLALQGNLCNFPGLSRSDRKSRARRRVGADRDRGAGISFVLAVYGSAFLAMWQKKLYVDLLSELLPQRLIQPCWLW